MSKKRMARGARTRWMVSIVALILGLQLVNAGAALARPGLIIATGVNSANYPIYAGGEAAVRADIDAQCKRINSRSTGANFVYVVGGGSVYGYGDCVI